MLRELITSRLHGESNLRIDRRKSRFRLLGLPTKPRKENSLRQKVSDNNKKRFKLNGTVQRN